ncbi:hypothetical protein Tco_0897670 [Tanacetum coccineum]
MYVLFSSVKVRFNPGSSRFNPGSSKLKLILVLLGVEKGDARSTWTWKRKCQLSLANWMQFGKQVEGNEEKGKETEDAQGQIKLFLLKQYQGDTVASPKKSKGSGSETERVQRKKGEDPMTEEDFQAEVQASKKSKELQELAGLEIRFLQKRFNKKKGSNILLRIEQSSYMNTIAAQRSFLQNKEVLLSETSAPNISQLRNLDDHLSETCCGDIKKHADVKDFWDYTAKLETYQWKLHSSSGLETEEKSSMALELIKFVKQQLEEFEDSNDDDSVTYDHEEAERILIFRVNICIHRPTSGIRATKGTLHKIEHRSKPFIPPNQIIMSANDNFSLHDDEELSLHDDASLDGSVPASNKGDAPAKPPQI